MAKHFDWMFDILVPAKQRLTELQNMDNNLYMHLICVCRSKSHSNIQMLSVKHAKILASLDIEFWFDAYFDDFLELLK